MKFEYEEEKKIEREPVAAETQRNQFPDEMLKAFDTLCSSLASAYRTGDLIPRDEITPQMAAEVLLSDPTLLAKAMAETMNGGMWSTPSHYNGDQQSVWESYAIAALTAIKESKDD